jgi:hypothetical protein
VRSRHQQANAYPHRFSIAENILLIFEHLRARAREMSGDRVLPALKAGFIFMVVIFFFFLLHHAVIRADLGSLSFSDWLDGGASSLCLGAVVFIIFYLNRKRKELPGVGKD